MALLKFSRMILVTCVVTMWLMYGAGAQPVEPQADLAVSSQLRLALEQSIRGVFDRLIAVQADHQVLKDLDEGALGVNAQGYPVLDYTYQLAENVRFRVYVAALPLESRDPLSGQQGFREFLYPSAGVKVVSFVEGRSGIGTFNFWEAVRLETARIDEVAQEKLPLRLFIQPAADSFEYGKKVEFDLELRNVSQKIWKLRKIDEGSTYCLFNGHPWGSREASGDESVILQPGESVRKKLRLYSDRRGTFEVFCSYGMGFNGIKPSARRMLSVE